MTAWSMEVLQGTTNAGTAQAHTPASICTDSLALPSHTVQSRLPGWVQVARWLKVVLLPGERPGISVRLNMEAIAALQLDVTPFSVMQAIAFNAPKLPLKMDHLRSLFQLLPPLPLM